MQRSCHQAGNCSAQEQTALTPWSLWPWMSPQVSRELSIRFLHTEGQRWHCSPLSRPLHKSIGKQINIPLLQYNFFSLLKGGSVNDYARTMSLNFQRGETGLCFRLGARLKLYRSQTASFPRCSFHQTSLKGKYENNHHCPHYQYLTSSSRTAWALHTV